MNQVKERGLKRDDVQQVYHDGDWSPVTEGISTNQRRRYLRTFNNRSACY